MVIDEYFKNKLFSEDKISMWIDVEGASGQVLFDDVMKFFTQNDFLLLARDFEWYEKVVRQENLIFVNRNYLYN